MILHQPGRSWELLDEKVTGETPESKAKRERRASPVCPAVRLWGPSISGLLQGSKGARAPLPSVCLAPGGKLGFQGQRG